MVSAIDAQQGAASTGKSRKESLGDILRRRSAVTSSERDERTSALQVSLDALTRSAQGALVDVPLEELQPNPFQPRFQFHRQPLEELAQSLAAEGQIEPVIARRVWCEGRSMLEIVTGARRLEAARICNASIRPFPTLRADVRDLTDEEAERISLIENLQRENLTPLEEGYRYWQLQQRDPRKWSVRAIAEFVHKKKSTVQNRLGLVRDPDVAEAVLKEQIPPTAGFHILRLPAAERAAYLRAAIDRSLTVEQVKHDVERRVAPLRGRASSDSAAPGPDGGDATAAVTSVQAHLRRLPAPARTESVAERRRALEERRAQIQQRINELEDELRGLYPALRAVERELATVDED